MKNESFKFKQAVEGGFIPYNLGRIGVGPQDDYNAVRFYITDKGLSLVVCKSAVDKGYVRIVDDTKQTQILGAGNE